MKRGVVFGLVLIALSVFMIAIVQALVNCPAGSHTFSGGTQASDYSMCIPDIGASGPVNSGGSSGSSKVSGNSGSESSSFEPSDLGIITPSGDTAQTAAQGRQMDSRVDLEVSRLSGTSIYEQARQLYDDSIAANKADFNSVSSQVRNVDPDTANSLENAYNMRALQRLNRVWEGIISLEEKYAQQQDDLAAKDEAKRKQQEEAARAQADLDAQEEEQNLQNEKDNVGGAGTTIPEFKSMINFPNNFQPLTMRLSESQLRMLGKLTDDQMNSFMGQARQLAIKQNPRLGSLSGANVQSSPLLKRLGNENSNRVNQISRSINLNSQGISNSMKDMVNAFSKI